MRIIGLKVEKYIGQKVTGHNCDFKYEDAEFERHIIYGILKDNKKVEIKLSRLEGICLSGWTIATWGSIEVNEIEKFDGYTFVPKKNLEIEDIEPEFSGDISNDVFWISIDGGDQYYPYGNYHVNMELFEETVRNKKLRPVWIFKGKSNSGKSFLASKLKDIDVYETDSSETLPESITASVIVLGNKYKFSLEDIKSKIFGKAEIQIVEFIN